MKLLFRDNFKRAETVIGASWDDDAASSANPIVAATLSSAGDVAKSMRIANGNATAAVQPNLVVMLTTNLGVLPRLQSLAGSYQLITANLPMDLTLGPCLIEGTPGADADGIWGGIKDTGDTLTWTVKKRVASGEVTEIFGGASDSLTKFGGTPDIVRIGLGHRMLSGGGAHIWLDVNGVRLGSAIDSSFNDPSATLRPGIATDLFGGSGRVWEYALYGLKL